jgi:hypothetical protein
MQNGIQRAVLRVASGDGGFIVIADTMTPKGGDLKTGDLVVWVPMIHKSKLARAADDERFGWIGFIGAKIDKIIPADGSFRVLERFD